MIIRPKSESNLLVLLKDVAENENTSRTETQLDLRVEQDLLVKPSNKGIQDDMDFEVWFDEMQEDLEATALEKYTYGPHERSLISRLYRAGLQERLHSCETILSHTSSLLSTLNDLKLGFSAVADQTSSFQIQCNTLIEEEVTSQSTLF